MIRIVLPIVLVLAAAGANAQAVAFERLAQADFDVLPPSGRVEGPPGEMRITERSCRIQAPADLRRRIVDIAVQEWGFFGFTVVDQTNIPDDEPPRQNRAGPQNPSNEQNRPRRPRVWLDPDESARVAESIAGYWAITPDGNWILSRQNDMWNGYDGIASRWRDPWSAAFISWVMCEAGLGESSRFQRAIAHHSYIDQAIVARDTGDAEAAFVAYDIGEQPIEPGDMLCAARRPFYRTLDERRKQLGVGIRSHCDIVVKVEPDQNRILGVGGNVRGTVSLKLLPAEFGADAGASQVERIGRGRSQIFAHLKLRDAPVAGDPLRESPTLRRIGAEPELLNRVRAVLDGAVSALSRSIL